MNKRTGLMLVAAVLVLAVTAYIVYQKSNTVPGVTDFNSCADAGYPVMESNPEQCRADGTTYTNGEPVIPTR
jgi:hypothetical protein